MLYIQNLRVKLQQRRNRVHKASTQQYETELRMFLQFLDDNIHLRSLIEELERSDCVDFAQWKQEQEDSRFFRFPSSEASRAKLCLAILRECADDPHEQKSIAWARGFSLENDYESMFNDLNETVLDAFHNYLDDRLDDAGDVLYLLERFKLKAEWFRADALRRLYFDDTGRGEKSLDRVLREALFDGGIDHPFSQPESPSGKADVVSLGGANDPLVLEVKVYDPERGKSASQLRQGFHQVLRYANDYQQAVGYLVVFNCSDNQLVFPSDNIDDGEFPPRIVHDGKTVFLISIELAAGRDPASQEDPKGRTEINRDQLIG